MTDLTKQLADTLRVIAAKQCGSYCNDPERKPPMAPNARCAKCIAVDALAAFDAQASKPQRMSETAQDDAYQAVLQASKPEAPLYIFCNRCNRAYIYKRRDDGNIEIINECCQHGRKPTVEPARTEAGAKITQLFPCEGTTSCPHCVRVAAPPADTEKPPLVKCACRNPERPGTHKPWVCKTFDPPADAPKGTK